MFRGDYSRGNAMRQFSLIDFRGIFTRAAVDALRRVPLRVTIPVVLEFALRLDRVRRDAPCHIVLVFGQTRADHAQAARRYVKACGFGRSTRLLRLPRVRLRPAGRTPRFGVGGFVGFPRGSFPVLLSITNERLCRGDLF